LIPLLAGILAAAALFLISMPFALVHWAGPPSRHLQSGPDRECQPERQGETRHPSRTLREIDVSPGPGRAEAEVTKLEQ
jgi:hypothetical protein